MKTRIFLLATLPVLSVLAAGCRYPYYDYRDPYYPDPAYEAPVYYEAPAEQYPAPAPVEQYQTTRYIYDHYCTGDYTCPVCYPRTRVVYVTPPPAPVYRPRIYTRTYSHQSRPPYDRSRYDGSHENRTPRTYGQHSPRPGTGGYTAPSHSSTGVKIELPKIRLPIPLIIPKILRPDKK